MIYIELLRLNLFIYNFKVKSTIYCHSMREQKIKPSEKQEYEEYKESFQIDDSHNSSTIIKIRRVKEKIIKHTLSSRLALENPYVFAKKSYGTKRESKQFFQTRQISPKAQPKLKLITKSLKIRIVNQEKKISKPSENKISLTDIHQYFRNSFFTLRKEEQIQKQLEENCNPIALKKFPTQLTKGQRFYEQINEKIMKEIEIVTNSNSKIKIAVHNALLNANNPIKLQESNHFLAGIQNKFNFQKRDMYVQKINFMKEYKSGYAPIQLQQNNQTDSKRIVGKGHFIRKKQTTLSLPRTCGVSYIKKSESTQKSPFEPLPPLIFQCSSGCDVDQHQTNAQTKLFLTKWHSYLQNSWLLFVQSDEDNMRSILLGEKKGKIRFVKGILNLWPLLAQGVFILIAIVNNFSADSHKIWEEFNNAEIKIGILGKRSTSGKKSFFKSVGIQIDSKQEEKNEDQNQQLTQNTMKILQTRQNKEMKFQKDECLMFLNEFAGNRNIITLSIRLEMYVHENKWKSYSKQTKNMLNLLIRSLKIHLQSKSLDIFKKRFLLAQSDNKKQILIKQLENLRQFRQQKQNSGIQIQPQISELNQRQIQILINKDFPILNINEQEVKKISVNLTFEDYLEKRQQNNIQKAFCLKMPLYYISTRDSFAFDLIQRQTLLQINGRKFKRTQYFFDADNLPANFGDFKKNFPNNQVGIVCYTNFFTEAELKSIENHTYQTERKAFLNSFLQMTVQPTITGSKIRRTKFFFGYRYMWTRCQLGEPYSYVGAGVRKDVTTPPDWIKQVQDPLVKCGLVQKDFINSIAINVYHDGKQGLAQHFDDAVRFKQPIFTVRLFSDARLSFGSQFYGFCNGAFVIPLPRGCICVMTENSYAANGVKHCVRPYDMTGKSAAIILRQMHSLVTSEVDKYDNLVDFPAWVSTLSPKSQNTISYAEQKKRQAEYLLTSKDLKLKNKY